MSPVELRLGQVISRFIDGESYEITITALNTRDVTFMIAGPKVEKPDEPRVMPITAFVPWVNSLERKETANVTR